MKKIFLTFILVCLPAVVSANDDQYYTIYDIMQPQEKEIEPLSDRLNNGITIEEGLNSSEAEISYDLYVLRDEIRKGKNLMYREINGFKQGF